MYCEKSIYFNKNKPKLSSIGNEFFIDRHKIYKNPEELKEDIFKNWRNFINEGSLEERVKEDYSIAMEKKTHIIDILDSVHDTEPLDPLQKYNSPDSIRIELKRKQLEVAARDIINSFQKYH